MVDTTELRIIQYNCRKQKPIMVELLNHNRIRDIDILAIQEPWQRSDINLTHNADKEAFHLIYPNSDSTRVCFFLNKRIALSSWYCTDHSPDLSTLHIKSIDHGTIHIHNIYNPQKDLGAEETMPVTMDLLNKAINIHPDDEHIALGDFNLHHQSWGGEHVRNDPWAEELLYIMEARAMTQLLPQGTPTYTENCSTTIDLIFASPGLTAGLVRCNIAKAFDAHSDHLPIYTSFLVGTKQATPKSRKNWKKIDQKKLSELVESGILTRDSLVNCVQHNSMPSNETEIDECVTDLIEVISIAIEASVPTINITPRSKVGFNEECKEAQMRCRRLKRRHSKHHTAESWEEYRQARNYKSYLIKRTMTRQFREFVAGACESIDHMWKSTRWSRDPIPRTACLPALRKDDEVVNEPAKKADLLIESFFPPPVTADVSDIETASYPEQLQIGQITMEEILQAIKFAPPNKAPGTDGIPNKVLKIITRQILKVLYYIYNASMTIGYCPQHFKDSVTVALRKPGKGDYTTPKSYRPIALLNTVGKLLEFIIAKRISAVAEKLNLLPPTHMGGRKLRSSEHSIHYIIERVFHAWNQGDMASMLLLDVSGAYDKVSHQRLIHDLKRKGIDNDIINWIRSFLSSRTTTLRTEEYTSPKTPIATGIPQGSPLSPILFLFYNSEILEQCTNRTDIGAIATGFVDDIGLLAIGKTTRETSDKLAKAHEEVCIPWARKHGSEFSPAKYQLLHLTRKSKADINQVVQLPDQQIKPSKTAKYLGLIFDTKLTWKEHINASKEKSLRSTGALARLTGTVWGGNYNAIRRIYLAVVVPQITYSCSAWFPQYKNLKNSTAFLGLEQIQGRAARYITGAYRATSFPALDMEAYITPIKLRLEETAFATLLRLITTPSYSDIIKPRASLSKRKLTAKCRKRSPLEILQHDFEARFGEIKSIEAFEPMIRLPNWIPPPTNILGEKEATRLVERIERNKQPGSVLYTDGSGINNKIGASAVSTMPLVRHEAYLGKMCDFTVYSGELYGIYMALLYIYVAAWQLGNRIFNIMVDNQSAIRSMRCPKTGSGQLITSPIVDMIDKIRGRGMAIKFHWIPAHKSLEGNERADFAAKHATGLRINKRAGKTRERDTDYTAHSTFISDKRLKAPIKDRIRQYIKNKWTAEWEEESKGTQLRSIAPHPSKDVQTIHKGIPRLLSSLITQMRTEKIGLNGFLHDRRVPGYEDREDGKCHLCGARKQTAGHILTGCRALTDDRKEYWADVYKGGTAEMLTTRSMKTKLAKRAAKYILHTGLIRHYAPYSNSNSIN